MKYVIFATLLLCTYSSALFSYTVVNTTETVLHYKIQGAGDCAIEGDVQPGQHLTLQTHDSVNPDRQVAYKIDLQAGSSDARWWGGYFSDLQVMRPDEFNQARYLFHAHWDGYYALAHN